MDWARSQQNVPTFQPFPNAGFSPGVYRSGNPFPGNSPANSPNSAQATTSIEDRLPEGTAASLPIESPSTGVSMGASTGALTGALNRAEGSHEWVGSTPAVGFQIHNRYLITQDEAGMVIIDQHALHERILFEQIKTKVLSRSLDRQRMLMPATVQLTSSEAAMAIESKAMLAEIGFEIESFGGDTVLLSAYPSILSKRAPEEMLRTVLEALMSGGKKVNAQDVLDELMNMMACKAAIKAGDRLSDPEISALLEQRHLYHDTHHCPHGRPTALFFSKEQLDKMFKRI
jgi:DNA mismatch repair protein MutL